MEVEDIIQDIIEKEDEELKQQEQSKNKEEVRKNKEPGIINWIQRITAICLFVLIISMVLPWFNLGGSTTYEGFARIPKGMLANEYKALDIKDQKDYEGVFIKTSPVQLLTYEAQYFNEHSKILNKEGQEKVSVLSWMHLFVIYGFGVVLCLALISILLLLIPKKLKFIPVIKYSGILSLIIICLNYFALKVTYFNMFALNALNELRVTNTYDAVELTQKGIAVKTTFYPYFMSVTIPFFIGLMTVLIWIVAAVLLGKIKKKKEQEINL